jgi:hypothetical protein
MSSKEGDKVSMLSNVEIGGDKFVDSGEASKRAPEPEPGPTVIPPRPHFSSTLTLGSSELTTFGNSLKITIYLNLGEAWGHKTLLKKTRFPAKPLSSKIPDP